MEWVENVFVLPPGMISGGHEPLLRCHLSLSVKVSDKALRNEP
jgi:hypothetical protein